MTIAGFCGSGKSYFIKYLINSFMNNNSTKFDFIAVFSNTGNFTQDYNFLKNINDLRFRIYNSVDVDKNIGRIMKLQKTNRENNKKRSVLIIFDDIFASVKDSKVFKDLVSTHRHYNISFAFSIQYISGAATYLREISQYIIIFEQRTLPALKLTYENYFQEFESLKDFKQYFRDKLKKYHFFFIDRQKNNKTVMYCP